MGILMFVLLTVLASIVIIFGFAFMFCVLGVLVVAGTIIMLVEKSVRKVKNAL